MSLNKTVEDKEPCVTTLHKNRLDTTDFRKTRKPVNKEYVLKLDLVYCSKLFQSLGKHQKSPDCL